MKGTVLIALLCGLAAASPTGELLNLGDAPLYHGGFYQGDMAGFDPNDRLSMVDARKLWPGALLIYELDSSVESIREYILEGMKDYEQKTCIRFRERTNEKDYVKIFWWAGCWSLVGQAGGEQPMSLGTGCHWKGLVVHELAHALGFYHEQQRPDRDNYIEILWGNIMEGLESNFDMYKYYEVNLLGEKFDYNSVMLYEETAFSKDGVARTVVPKTPGVTLVPVWKKDGLSESDIRRVNRLYQCNGNVRPDPPPVPDHFCDFETDNCGVVNQENMGSDFYRKRATLGGRTSNVMIMQNVDVNEVSSGGRLITPHFQNYGRDYGCLSFDYYLDGAGVEYLMVSLQGHTTYDVITYRDKSPSWKTFRRTISYSEGDPRMFILAVHRGKQSDFTFAIDNLGFVLRPC